ncbi:hypothetical protein [Pseudomonas sp. NPDC086278]|uniref:hypothetical protein n=1 Tax=Pseudomonas sp. NPDC086278 TaxID=3390646 RepID=UPI003D007DFF
MNYERGRNSSEDGEQRSGLLKIFHCSDLGSGKEELDSPVPRLEDKLRIHEKNID